MQNHSQGASHIVPHPRTLRKARESVKWMVADGVSRPKIKNYLVRWLCWWVRTSNTWNYHELCNQYIESCWENEAATLASEMLSHYCVTELHTGALALAA